MNRPNSTGKGNSKILLASAEDMEELEPGVFLLNQGSVRLQVPDKNLAVKQVKTDNGTLLYAEGTANQNIVTEWIW